MPAAATRRHRQLRRALVLTPIVGSVIAGLLSTGGPAAADPAPVFTSAAPLEAVDYATRTFADPWDYNNGADLDAAMVRGAQRFVVANGTATWTASGTSTVTPLTAGMPGSLHLGRDGNLAPNRINAATYTRLHLHAYVSKPTIGAMFWFTQDGDRNLGGARLSFTPGWHDYDIRLANEFAGKAAWAGSIQGLRLQFNTAGGTTAALDFMRLYQPAADAGVTWQSPTGRDAQLYWSSTAAMPASGTGSTFGPVVTNGSDGVSTVRPTRTDLSGYPAGTHFYAVSGGQVVGSAITMIPRPNPVVDSPSSTGCGDYSTWATGHAWRFTSSRDVTLRNATAVSFAGGVLSATNGAPSRNDPQVYLPVNRSLDGRRWHRLTIVSSYDGAYSLANAPGGGAMGRFMWRANGQKLVSQTNDLITLPGRRAINIDLAMPTSVLTEPEANPRYAFAGAPLINQLRWDPNEDPGARRWHLYSVRLAEDCWTRSTFAVTWHDSAVTPGSVATISARLGSRTYNLATVAEHAGSNSYTVNGRALPAGRYTVIVTVNNGRTSFARGGGSPLIIAH